MPLDFPNHPLTVGQKFVGSNGAVWVWDGTAWGPGPAGGTGSIGSSPPAAPVAGELWWDTVSGQLYVWFDDGNSQQWVIANNLGAAALGDAPLDGTLYGRQSGSWSPAASPAAYNNVGRNLLHNPLFNIQQRGAGAWTSLGAYTADRWGTGGVSDTVSFSVVALADADRAQIGDESASSALQNVFTGNAAGGAYSNVNQPIERLRRLSGKAVTLSFWAKCASGALKLGINALLKYGTGGSPTAAGWAMAAGQGVTLSATWARYTVSLAIPSTAGATFGTNGDDSLLLCLIYSSGATNNAVFGSPGVQSGTIQLWGVQLEIGTAATPLEKMDPRMDLANCQRFYQAFSQVMVSGYNSAGATNWSDFSYLQQMRAVPSVAFANTTYANGSSLSVNGATLAHVRLQMTVGSAGASYSISDMLLSADL